MKVGDNIFVYGTLKAGYGANSLLQGNAEFIRDDRISAEMFDLGAFPGIKTVAQVGEGRTEETVPFISEGPTVFGEVYRIADDALPGRLDRYEGYPTLYGRREFETENGLRVWAYEYRDNVDAKRLVASGKWG